MKHYLSPCWSALILVRAAAASSRAQLTDEVKRLNTSGSAKALPSEVDNLPNPETKRFLRIFILHSRAWSVNFNFCLLRVSAKTILRCVQEDVGSEYRTFLKVLSTHRSW